MYTNILLVDNHDKVKELANKQTNKQTIYSFNDVQAPGLHTSDNAHMKSMKIVQFSRPPPPPCSATSKILPPP